MGLWPLQYERRNHRVTWSKHSLKGLHCVHNYTYSNDSCYGNVIKVIIIKVLLWCSKREVKVQRPHLVFVRYVYNVRAVTNKVILFVLGYDQVVACRNLTVVATAFLVHIQPILRRYSNEYHDKYIKNYSMLF